MGQAERPTCPGCGAFLVLALPPGGNGPRTFQGWDCDRPDPLKTDNVTGWLKSELQPPKRSTPIERVLAFIDASDWDAKAIEALESARAMPPGQGKTEALKKAGMVRNAADR